MMDHIIIENLKVRCNHGVYEEEKILGQNFYVSAILEVDAKAAALGDDLDQSVNYAELCHKISDFMKCHRYKLIETVAYRLVSFIMNEYDLIRGIRLKISKPEAPIGLPFENVSVEIYRKWHHVFIATGSNMGDSKKIIENAVNSLKSDCMIRVLRESSLITTKPYGGVSQDDFLNGCIEIETLMEPEELLEKLHLLEKEAGRERIIHWGPRTLDLDILLYDDEIVASKDLEIPHPDMQNRTFVLEPLCEIAPYLIHPLLNKKMTTILKELNNRNKTLE